MDFTFYTLIAYYDYIRGCKKELIGQKGNERGLYKGAKNQSSSFRRHNNQLSLFIKMQALFLFQFSGMAKRLYDQGHGK